MCLNKFVVLPQELMSFRLRVHNMQIVYTAEQKQSIGEEERRLTCVHTAERFLAALLDEI